MEGLETGIFELVERYTTVPGEDEGDADPFLRMPNHIITKMMPRITRTTAIMITIARILFFR